MKVIKKINNNVAICVDGNGNELVAFGKGIGFPKVPYEVTDLRKITMTFYRVDDSYIKMIQDIPESIFEVAAIIVKKAQSELNSSLNPNLIVGLADHINFAIMRVKKYKKLKMVFSYDIEQLYPQETELGRYAIKTIYEYLHIALPDSEITNIAVHFVNAEEESVLSFQDKEIDAIIDETTNIIEKYFQKEIDRKSFSYNRFITHLRYYVQRISKDEQFVNDVSELVNPLVVNNDTDIYKCALEVTNYIDKKLKAKSTNDEILYLMIHINRIVNKTN